MFKYYIQTTLRNLIKNKAVSLINISGLVVGFAACLLISQYVYHEKSYDTFHKNFKNIYRVVNVRHYPSHTDLSAGCTSMVGPALKENFPEVIDFARCYSNSAVFTYHENTIHLNNVFTVDSSFYTIFSFPVIEGKKSHLLTQPYTAIITTSAAKRLFGNKNPIGESIIRSDSKPYFIEAIVNDAPANSNIHFDLLVSMLSDTYKNEDYCWTCNNKNTYILLANNANVAAFENKLQQIIPKIHKDEGFKREYKLQTLAEIHLTSKLRFELGKNGDAKNVLFLTLVAFLIIIIAWFNYINLSISMAMGRSKEVGIKKIIGSNKKKLIFQFLFEALFINIISLTIALLAVKLALPFFSSFIPSTHLPNQPRFWIILILILLSGTAIYGIYPSIVISSFNPLSVLKGNSDRRKKQYYQRIILVVCQFVISIILISASFIVYRQVSFMKNKELGMNISQTLVVPRAQVYLQNTNYNGRKETFENELLKNLNIQEIASSSNLPGEENDNVSGGIRIEGSSIQAGQQIYTIHVSQNYFNFLKIPFISGKNFSSVYKPKKDIIPVQGDDQPIVINETACRYFGFKNPNEALDKMIIGDNDRLGRIIGVIKDHHNQTIDKPINPVIYKCVNNFSYFLIKTKTTDIPQTIAYVENNFKSLYPDNPFEYFFLDEFFDAQYVQYSKFAIIFSIFTILAILVACIGLLGLVTYSAKVATKEIGIRRVNGAKIFEILIMLNKDFIKWVAIAFIIACPIAWYAMHTWLQNFAYKTELSWWVFALAGIVAVIVALLTVSWQSWRAATRNPVEALRYE